MIQYIADQAPAKKLAPAFGTLDRYVLRSWQKTIKEHLARWPGLVAYYQRLAKRPSIAAALEAEGLGA